MLQRLMAYIVDFTIIMQVIFGFVVHARLHLSRRLMNLALKTYSNSEVRSNVHKDIMDHVKRAGLLKRDAALAKIIELTKEYEMKTESMEELQSVVKTFENDEAEDWGLGQAELHHLITYVPIKALLSNCQCHNPNRRYWF